MNVFLKCSAVAMPVVIPFLLYDGNDYVWKYVGMPLIHKLDPETAHNLSIFSTKLALNPKIFDKYSNELFLGSRLFGRYFKNPIGLAAGFDKNGECFHNLTRGNFGFIEVGTVTPARQEGNPKPRIFRFNEELSVVNSCGFNNVGIEQFMKNVKQNKKHKTFVNSRAVLGINIGMNKDNVNPVFDYEVCAEKAKDYADYMVINVSSPNTVGLRSLQSPENLGKILQAINNKLVEAETNKRKVPLLVKLSPDLSDLELYEIVDFILESKMDEETFMIDGFIISNTTIGRDYDNIAVNFEIKSLRGGLSGAPLKEPSTEMIAKVYKKTEGKIPIIGVGGVFTGQDAFDKIANGASLVQIYSCMVFEGPTVVRRINEELLQILKDKGFRNVSEAVGYLAI